MLREMAGHWFQASLYVMGFAVFGFFYFMIFNGWGYLYSLRAIIGGLIICVAVVPAYLLAFFFAELWARVTKQWSDTIFYGLAVLFWTIAMFWLFAKVRVIERFDNYVCPGEEIYLAECKGLDL